LSFVFRKIGCNEWFYGADPVFENPGKVVFGDFYFVVFRAFGKVLFNKNF